MKVINLFGGPGTGKSTTAAGLFHLMKLQSMEVELVTEYAKYLVWAQRNNMFTEQDYIFAKQNHRLRILQNKVDWAITDSPLILGQFYMPDGFPGKDHFVNFMHDVYDSYENINIFLVREKAYNPNGRNQTEDEAKQIDQQILDMLGAQKREFLMVVANDKAPEIILKLLTATNK